MTDTSGAVVPNAKVVVVNDATNVRFETKTNNDGIYVEANLPPGVYHIEITREGFKTLMQPGIELHVQDIRAANYTLQVGAASETVTVQAESYMINTQDAAVSTTIDRNFAENIPLSGRSFQTLLLLTPGIVTTVRSADDGTFSVNGQRANANSFTVDGVSANVGGFLNGFFGSSDVNGANPNLTFAGTTQGMVTVDALQEFKIQTSSYAPEFGRQPGGQVSLSTRSGTNSFHGTAFDYLRNDALDANNWFNDATIDPATGKTLPKGKERQNDFGGTFGGPILRDKTFFFFSYEGLRLLQPTTETVTTVSRQPGPANLFTQAAAVFQPLLNAYPIPNSTDNGDGTANYVLDASQPIHFDSYSIKVDQAFGSRLHLFGRYAQTTTGQVVPDQASSFVDSQSQKLVSRGLTLGTDATVSPRMASELRLNYTVNLSSNFFALSPVGGGKPFDISTLFPAPYSRATDEAGILLSIASLGGGINLGSQGRDSQRQINILDNLSYSRGAHQFRWGGDYRRLFPIVQKVPRTLVYGIFSPADLQAGNFTFAAELSDAVAHPIYVNFGAYGQDTWKISRSFTLTYGLRWELSPPPGERDGKDKFMLNLLGVSNPATATVVQGAPVYKTTYNNFAPRVGIAYQIRPTPGRQTVLRAGFGMFYDLNSQAVAGNFAAEGAFTNVSNVEFSVPFPLTGANIPSIAPLPAPNTPPYVVVNAVDPNLRLPYTFQWNLSLEQSLGKNQTLTASYVAAAGERLLRTDTLINYNAVRPDLFQSGMTSNVLRNASSSNYQALQVQFNRRLSSGLQALGSYTYSHSLDDASDGLSSPFLGSNALPDPRRDWGNSDFDLRHAFRAAVTYSIPALRANPLTRSLLGGWSVDAIGLAQSGPPEDIVGNLYFLPSGSSYTLRPNAVPGVPYYLSGSQYPGGMSFNNTVLKGACPDGSNQVGAFCPVPRDVNGNPTQAQGTLGRNALRGLGAWQTDFAVHRQFNFTERVNLQFRGEFFNLLNHPNFGPLNKQLFNGAFGVSQYTLNAAYGGLNSLYQIGGPRSVQLALKFGF